jgi:hypothetical protein
MTLTESILVQIRSMGYVVKVFKVNSTVEMHAVHLAGERDAQIARCNDGDTGRMRNIARLACWRRPAE